MFTLKISCKSKKADIQFHSGIQWTIYFCSFVLFIFGGKKKYLSAQITISNILLFSRLRNCLLKSTSGNAVSQFSKNYFHGMYTLFRPWNRYRIFRESLTNPLFSRFYVCLQRKKKNTIERHKWKNKSHFSFFTKERFWYSIRDQLVLCQIYFRICPSRF